MVLLVLGVVFRFVNLNHKVYWHDEVYTTLRAAGYTRQEIDRDLFQNQVIPAGELQRYQQLKPGSTVQDTVRSLAVEDPQHPPLYFLLTRVWMQVLDQPLKSLFHSSLTTQRSLPALISLLALPAMYALAWKLFASPAVALLATTLLALSPFDLLFAQTARQYSLLTVMVILSHVLLLRALQPSKQRSANRAGKRNRLQSVSDWGLYALAVCLGLYTQPLFALTIAGHAVYVGLVTHPNRSPQWFRSLWRWSLAVLTAVLLYSPWLVVMLGHRERVAATTDWTRVSPGLLYLLKLWLLSFTSLFFDLDFGFENPVTFLLRLPILVLIGLSLYSLWRQTDRKTWLFILTSIAVPFVLLALPDLVLGGKRSAISRYLIPCYPSIQLAVAYFLSTQLAIQTQYLSRRDTYIEALRRSQTPHWLRFPDRARLKRWCWRLVLASVAIASLLSLTVSALSFSWWNKDLSYFNDRVAHQINMVSAPLVISDRGDDYTNTGDLISLSYQIRPDVPLLLVNLDTAWMGPDQLRTELSGHSVLVFRPSSELKQWLQERHGFLSPRLQAANLWQLTQPNE